MNRTFVLIDASQGAKCSNGESLSPALLGTLRNAYSIYLNLHVASVFGGDYLVRIGPVADPGEVACTILPMLPQNDGAEAYHDDAGGPVILDGIGDSGSLYGPGNSHSMAVTHEMVEVIGNPAINRWADQVNDPTTATLATACEVADPFEAQGFPIIVDGIQVYVSDFALPSWLDPQGTPPFSYMRSRGMAGAVDANKPFDVVTGIGYRNDRNLRTGQVTQVGLASRRPGIISRRARALGVGR